MLPERTGDAGAVEFAVIVFTDEPEPDSLVVLRTTDTNAVIPVISRDPFVDRSGPANADELRDAHVRYSVVATNQVGVAAATPTVDSP